MFRDELKETIKLALPMIVSQLLGYAIPVIDTIMAGRESPLVLASVALGAHLYAFIYFFMLGLIVAVATMVARYHGAGDIKRIRYSFQQGLWLALMLAVLSFFLLWGAAEVPYWVGTRAEVAAETKRYLHTLALGGALSVLSLLPRYFLEGVSYPQFAIKVLIAIIPINIVGNYLFLKGFWIVPPLGAQGMALASSLCFIVYAVSMFAYLWRGKRFQSYRLWRAWQPPQWLEIRTLLKIGLPMGAANLFELGLFAAVNLIVSRGDVLITSANQIALNYSGLSFMFPLGLAYALTVRSGYLLGAQDRKRLQACMINGLCLCLSLMFVLTLLIVFCGREIASLYTANHELIDLTSKILMVVAMFQLFDGLQVSAVGVLRGLHDSQKAMVYAIIGYWILGLPLGLLFAYPLGYGIFGLWVGISLGLLANATLAMRRVYYWYRLQNEAL